MPEPPFTLNPRDICRRVVARGGRSHWRLRLWMIVVGQRTCVGALVILADTSPFGPPIGRPHWDRFGIAIVGALGSFAFVLVMIANFEVLSRLVRAFDRRVDAAARAAATAHLSWSHDALLRPSALVFASTVIVLTLLAAINWMLAGLVGLVAVTWLSWTAPYSLAHAWTHERAFFGPRTPEHPIRSAVIALLGGSACAGILLAVA